MSHPDIADVIDEVSKNFPGAKVTYVAIDGEQFGQQEPVGFTVGIDMIRPRLLSAETSKKVRR